MTKPDSPSDATSELGLLRTQVELYFNDLKEEKKKRAQEEVHPIHILWFTSFANTNYLNQDQSTRLLGTDQCPQRENSHIREGIASTKFAKQQCPCVPCVCACVSCVSCGFADFSSRKIRRSGSQGLR